jgi:amino acid transporter
MEATPTTAPAPEARGITGSTELARNALGLPQVLFCIVTGSAPLAAMMFNDPLSGLGIGISVPAAFWLATVSFTFFSVAYIEMARRVTTAGGIYSYTAYGFGRIIGLGAAVGIAAAYMLFTVGVTGSRRTSPRRASSTCPEGSTSTGGCTRSASSCSCS